MSRAAAVAAAFAALAAGAAPVAADAPPAAAHEPSIEVDGVPVALPPSGEAVPVGALSPEEVDRIGRLAMGVGTSSGTTSPDGAIRVLAPVLAPADRAELLALATDLRDALETKLGARGASPAAARHASFRTDDSRLLLRCVADAADTNAPARIDISLDPHAPGRDWQIPLVATVTNPTNGLDPRVLAARIVRGWLDLKVLTLAWAADDPAARPARLPAWFADGVARSLDPATRQDDFDRVRDAFLADRLPSLPALLAADAPAPAADAALAAQLVEFWLSAPGTAERFGRLCQALAGGREWTPELYFSTSGRPADPVAAGDAFGAWVRERSAIVLSPGETTGSLVARTAEAMRLIPGRDGVPAGFADGPQPLERLLEPDVRDWAPEAARRLKAEVMRGAFGRGDAYRAACAAYAEFFDEAARPAPALGRAIPLLREARARLAAAEAEDRAAAPSAD